MYVLFNVLHFVIVLYQSGGFEYKNIFQWLDRGGEGEAVVYICKTYYVRRENCFGGLKTRLQGTFKNYNVPPRGFYQVWLNAYLSLKINMQ